MRQLIVFDLDGTLAESKSPLDAEIAVLLRDLLGIVKVAVISGGNWAQFEQQLISGLPDDADLGNLSLLPTCGTKFYQFDTGWKQLYSEDLTAEEKATVTRALQRTVETLGFGGQRIWGVQIEDRGSQLTFSALGQLAPLDAKKAWDPDYSKRKAMKAALDKLIPEFSIRLGGTTSVDITRPGIDKGYGIKKLRDILGTPIKDMIFIGDAVFPGGNDYPAKAAGVLTIQVRDPNETKRVIEAIIACLPTDQRDKLLQDNR
jgi:phosphomannomutase